jgi:hypothetical protein
MKVKYLRTIETNLWDMKCIMGLYWDRENKNKQDFTLLSSDAYEV